MIISRSILQAELFLALQNVYVLSTLDPQKPSPEEVSLEMKSFLLNLNPQVRDLYMAYLLDILITSNSYADGLTNVVVNLSLLKKVHEGQTPK